MAQSNRKRLCVVIGTVSLLLPACILSVQARPRDDVMAGVYRCSAIGPSRLWLDCFYGAAQPARLALHLASALEAQSQLVVNPPAGTPQNQAVRDGVVREAARCDGEDRAWLDCYYAAAQPMRILLGLAPAPQHVQSAVAEAGQAPQVKELPSGNWLLGSRKGVTARLKDYHRDKDGRFTVTLANGEVWRQTAGDVHHPELFKPAGSYVVTISRGALGSTNLQLDGEQGLYKVEPG